MLFEPKSNNNQYQCNFGDFDNKLIYKSAQCIWETYVEVWKFKNLREINFSKLKSQKNVICVISKTLNFDFGEFL